MGTKLMGLLLLIAFVKAEDDGFIFPDQYERFYIGRNPPARPNNFPSAAVSAPAVAFSAQAPPPDILPPFWSKHVNSIISRGVLKFALDLNRVSKSNTTLAEHKNVIFSPLSLAGTMAMVLLASSGRTFEEVARILGLHSGVDVSGHSEIVHQMFGSLISGINGPRAPGEPVASYASGIFVQNNYPIRPEFSLVSNQVYKSDVINLDFQKQPGIASDAINSWVKERTGGKITQLLSEPLSSATKVVLASALYYMGEWDQFFQLRSTKRERFYIEPNLPVEVDMMYNGGEFLFHEDQNIGAKIIALPYKGLQVKMYIVLPTAEGARALKSFEDQLTIEKVEGLINRMVNSTCIFALPRMKLSSTLHLREALESLGLASLFNPRTADLSILSPGPGENTFKLRLGDDDEEPETTENSSQPPPNKPNKINQISYIDNIGYKVHQWNSGFDIRRFRSDVFSRVKRQNRPIDEEFLNFVNSQNLASYGLDNLRNSHRTVNPGLFAQEVIHKVEININERGTEAAAATAVSIQRGGDIKRFLPDRPFLFFIRDDSSKLIWFWGTVNKPEPSYPIS